ncbi:MAG TPA: DUF3592 domain-containing protein [Nakamurella sp.]
MPAWLGLLLLIVPVVIVAAFGTRQVRESSHGRAFTTVPDGWLPARGVVVDERSWRRRRRAQDGTKQPMRQPIITFQSTDGREITFTSRIHAAGMPRPGALVGVFHDPGDPTRACIAPDALKNVAAPMGGAAKATIGTIWLLAGITTLVFVLVLFDA